MSEHEDLRVCGIAGGMGSGMNMSNADDIAGVSDEPGSNDDDL